MNGRYEFREDLLPICLLLTRCTLHAEDAARIYSHYRALCERRIRFVAVSDVRAAKSLPDLATCQSFGEEAKRFAVEGAPWCIGGAIIVGSPLIRGALNGIAWLYHAESNPQFFCGDMRTAVNWAVETLTTNGIAIPPSVQAFARAPELD
ncbi:MAG TPA: hypothetical protein VJU61_22860 [Polyangiaceae bacterium]|nr:hypothetical protein [Polyangiaceae bacterium]